MFYRLNFLFLIYLLLIINIATSQERVRFNPKSSYLEYGFSGKIIIDLSSKTKYSNYRIGFASGIGYDFFESTTTSLNLEYSILLRGLGTYNNGTSSYFVIAPHLCQTLDNNNFSDLHNVLLNNQPLYYFTDLIPPPLQNRFRKSVSIGANFIHFFNKNQTSKWQRVAHLGLKFNDAQLVYNNDGGALLKKWGDKEDRYFTGCGFLHIHLRDDLTLNDFAISFYKFTGYNNMSFEVGDELLYSSVDYKDLKQNLFNRGLWSFQVGNSRYGDIFVRYNNPRNTKEVQNFIHYNMGFGYHQNLTDSFYSIGGSLNYYQTNIPGK